MAAIVLAGALRVAVGGGQEAADGAGRVGAREWDAITQRLGNKDFAVREAAQEELGKISPDEMEVMLKLAEGQTDSEVKTRLRKRVGEMAIERAAQQMMAKRSVAGHITGRVVDGQGKGALPICR